MATNEVRQHNVVVLGAGSVGKSALTIQFTSRIFQSVYEPTVEDNFVQNVIIDSKNCQLSILDTAGEDDLSVMREKYFKIGQVFILVYSITDRSTLENIEHLIQYVLKIKEKDTFPMLIVGNKKDLEGERQVKTEEGKELAEKYHCAFMESTATKYDSAYEVFANACREIWKTEDDEPIKKKKKKCNLL